MTEDTESFFQEKYFETHAVVDDCDHVTTDIWCYWGKSQDPEWIDIEPVFQNDIIVPARLLRCRDVHDTMLYNSRYIPDSEGTATPALVQVVLDITIYLIASPYYSD